MSAYLLRFQIGGFRRTRTMQRERFYDIVRLAIATCGYCPYFVFEGDTRITGVLPVSDDPDMPMMSDADFDIRQLISSWSEVPALLGVLAVEGVAVVTLQAPSDEEVRAYVMFVLKGEEQFITLRRMEMAGAADNEAAWVPCGNMKLTVSQLFKFFEERNAKGYRSFYLSEGSLRAVFTASQQCAAE